MQMARAEKADATDEVVVRRAAIEEVSDELALALIVFVATSDGFVGTHLIQRIPPSTFNVEPVI